MSDFPVVQPHSLYARAHTLTYSTPFLQSQCTGGYLCGSAFQQNGCYASPDYSTCYYDSSEGASVCTVCICHGYDTGEIGCDGSGGNPGGNNPGGNPNPNPSPTGTSTPTGGAKLQFWLIWR